MFRTSKNSAGQGRSVWGRPLLQGGEGEQAEAEGFGRADAVAYGSVQCIRVRYVQHAVEADAEVGQLLLWDRPDLPGITLHTPLVSLPGRGIHYMEDCESRPLRLPFQPVEISCLDSFFRTWMDERAPTWVFLPLGANSANRIGDEAETEVLTFSNIRGEFLGTVKAGCVALRQANPVRLCHGLDKDRYTVGLRLFDTVKHTVVKLVVIPAFLIMSCARPREDMAEGAMEIVRARQVAASLCMLGIDEETTKVQRHGWRHR